MSGILFKLRCVEMNDESFVKYVTLDPMASWIPDNSVQLCMQANEKENTKARFDWPFGHYELWRSLLRISEQTWPCTVLEERLVGSQLVRFMLSTWVLSSPGGSHVGPMNLAIRGTLQDILYTARRLSGMTLLVPTFCFTACRPLTILKDLLRPIWQTFKVDHHFCPLPGVLMSSISPSSVEHLCWSQSAVSLRCVQISSQTQVAIMPITIWPVINKNIVRLSGLGSSQRKISVPSKKF